MHGLMITYPLKRLRHAARVIVAGAANPASINQVLGFETTGSVEAAIERAQDYHGKDASIVFVKYPILACRQ